MISRKRHFGGADLNTDDLEFARDLATRRLRDALVREERLEFLVLGNAGDDRHQMRFTGAVVADDQQALVVLRLGVLKLGDDHVANRSAI